MANHIINRHYVFDIEKIDTAVQCFTTVILLSESLVCESEWRRG